MTEATSRPPGGTSPDPKVWMVPASYAQERVWFASQLTHGASVYHVVDQFEVRNSVSAEDVVAALTLICERHEALRTAFCVRNGELMQVVHPHVVPDVQHLDFSHLADDDQQRRIGEIFDSLAATAIPLDRAPLWRATLVRLGAAGWVLLVVAHHAAFDAASALNLRAELTELCAAAAQGRPASLPELPVQYADYAVWQRDRMERGHLEELLRFWRQELAGLPAVHALRTDLPRPAERSFAGADLIFALPAGADTAAAGLARQASATPFMVMFAAYAALLYRLSGRDDIVIGLPVAGRDRPELQPLIGMFVNMIVVRVDAGGDPAFTELLDRARLALLEAWDHQEMPFQKLVEVLPQHRDAGLPPLYQLGFNYLSIGFSRSSAAAEDDLMLEISKGHGRLEYNTALFTEQTARRIADGYQHVLRAVTADPGVRMSELPVAGPAAETSAPDQPGARMPELAVAGPAAETSAPDQPGARMPELAVAGPAAETSAPDQPGARMPELPVAGPAAETSAPDQPGARMPELPVAGPAAETSAPDQPAGRPSHVPPRSAAEELVAGVWSEVLGTGQVGALDDFFDLGGHSLLALRVIARLSAATDTELTIQSFFADTTVAGVAAELERLLTAELTEMSDDEAARLVAGEG